MPACNTTDSRASRAHRLCRLTRQVFGRFGSFDLRAVKPKPIDVRGVRLKSRGGVASGRAGCVSRAVEQAPQTSASASTSTVADTDRTLFGNSARDRCRQDPVASPNAQEAARLLKDVMRDQRDPTSLDWLVALGLSQRRLWLTGLFLYGMDTEQVTASLVCEVSGFFDIRHPVPALPVSSQFIAQTSQRDIESLCSVCSVTVMHAQSAKDMSAFDLRQCYSVTHHCTSSIRTPPCWSVGPYG